jgi:hypothetical protein
LQSSKSPEFSHEGVIRNFLLLGQDHRMALLEQTLDQLLLAGVAGDQNRFRTERGVQSSEHIAAEKDLNFDGHAGLVSEVA